MNLFFLVLFSTTIICSEQENLTNTKLKPICFKRTDKRKIKMLEFYSKHKPGKTVESMEQGKNISNNQVSLTTNIIPLTDYLEEQFLKNLFQE